MHNDGKDSRAAQGIARRVEAQGEVIKFPLMQMLDRARFACASS